MNDAAAITASFFTFGNPRVGALVPSITRKQPKDQDGVGRQAKSGVPKVTS